MKICVNGEEQELKEFSPAKLGKDEILVSGWTCHKADVVKEERMMCCCA